MKINKKKLKMVGHIPAKVVGRLAKFADLIAQQKSADLIAQQKSADLIAQQKCADLIAQQNY